MIRMLRTIGRFVAWIASRETLEPDALEAALEAPSIAPHWLLCGEQLPSDPVLLPERASRHGLLSRERLPADPPHQPTGLLMPSLLSREGLPMDPVCFPSRVVPRWLFAWEPLPADPPQPPKRALPRWLFAWEPLPADPPQPPATDPDKHTLWRFLLAPDPLTNPETFDAPQAQTTTCLERPAKPAPSFLRWLFSCETFDSGSVRSEEHEGKDSPAPPRQ